MEDSGSIMALSISITTASREDHTLLTFTVSGDVPSQIFLYENTGTTVLGEYQEVVGVSDFERTGAYSETVATPIFGNKFLRHTIGYVKIPYGSTTTAQATIDKVVADIKAFRSEYLTRFSGSTQIITVT
jgi:hypothetical protein